MRFCLTALLALGLSSAASAGSIPFDRSWASQKFSLFSGNSYAFNGRSLSVASDDSVSLVYRRLEASDWGSAQASWSWAVQDSVPATNLRNKGGDDRNLALYFVFLPQATAERLSGANVRRVLRQDDARVLVYVWGGDHRRGQVLASPYLGSRGKTIVLRAAGTGSHSERVDLASDYARAFGGGQAALVGVAVSADSDDTDSRIRAQISNLAVR